MKETHGPERSGDAGEGTARQQPDETPRKETPASKMPAAGATTGVTRALAPVGRALTSSRGPRIRTGVALVTGSLTAVIAVILVLAAYELALAAYALGVPRKMDQPPRDGPGTPAA